MKTWLKELEYALQEKFYAEEITDIIDYYEEMISDRVATGEKIDDVLSAYDIKEIIKEVTPEVLIKRENSSVNRVSRSTKQLILLLLGTPILLPLGILYLAILIVVVAIMIAITIGIFTGLIGFIGLLITSVQTSIELPNLIGISGLGLVSFGLLMLFSIWLYQITTKLWKKLIVWFSKLAHKKGEK